MDPNYDAANAYETSLAETEEALGRRAILHLTGEITDHGASASGRYVKFEVDDRWGFREMSLTLDLEALEILRGSAESQTGGEAEVGEGEQRALAHARIKLARELIGEVYAQTEDEALEEALFNKVKPVLDRALIDLDPNTPDRKEPSAMTETVRLLINTDTIQRNWKLADGDSDYQAQAAFGAIVHLPRAEFEELRANSVPDTTSREGWMIEVGPSNSSPVADPEAP